MIDFLFYCMVWVGLIAVVLALLSVETIETVEEQEIKLAIIKSQDTLLALHDQIAKLENEAVAWEITVDNLRKDNNDLIAVNEADGVLMGSIVSAIDSLEADAAARERRT